MSQAILPALLEGIVDRMEGDIVRPPWQSTSPVPIDATAPDEASSVPGVPEPPD
jgi:hypothetical protein